MTADCLIPGRRRMTKKGLSPLIATVLLIAFAVALGAVVMNWGSSYVGEGSAEEGCDKVSLSWFERSGKQQVCYTDERVEFTVESKNMDVHNLKMIIDGEKEIEIIDDILAEPMRIADIKKVSVPYPVSRTGRVVQIKLVPTLESEGSITTCPSDRGLVKENLERC